MTPKSFSFLYTGMACFLLHSTPAFAGEPGLLTIGLLSGGAIFGLVSILIHRLMTPVKTENDNDIPEQDANRSDDNKENRVFPPDVLTKLDWKSLEFIGAECFKGKRNVKTKLTVAGIDNGGINVRLVNSDGETTLIVCDIEHKGVSLGRMHELIGIKTLEKAKTLVILSFGKTEKETRQMGIAHGIRIISAEELSAFVANLPEMTQNSLRQSLLGKDDWDKPSCPKCGKKMTKSKMNSSYKCPRFPECSGTLDIPC